MPRILWLSPTPCGAIEKMAPNIVVGGWLQSLEKQLVCCEDIELHVIFYHESALKHFKFNKTDYYPIVCTNCDTKFGKLINKISLSNKNDEKDLLKIKCLIDTIQPDLIHVHGTENNFGLIQKYIDIPVVISIQGLLSPYEEKFFSGISQFHSFIYEGIKSKIFFNSANSLFKRMKKNALREKEILKLSKYILGRTDWDKRITRILAPESRYFVSNEILRSVFYDHVWDKSNFERRIQIVSTSTGNLYKGLETIVKVSQILSSNSNVSFEWVVVGQSENGYLAKLVKRLLKVNYSDLNIHFKGKKTSDELVKILVDSDIYCQVSHIENSPNSLCEAMMIGMPIVASFVGGTDSLLINKRDGILVQDGDPYSYAGAITELLQNFEQAKEYGKMARIKSLERHNCDTIVKSLIETYATVLKN